MKTRLYFDKFLSSCLSIRYSCMFLHYDEQKYNHLSLSLQPPAIGLSSVSIFGPAVTNGVSPDAMACWRFSRSKKRNGRCQAYLNMRSYYLPCAHIAAPTRFEIVNAKPTMGILSRRAAAKPKADDKIRMSSILQ